MWDTQLEQPGGGQKVTRIFNTRYTISSSKDWTTTALCQGEITTMEMQESTLAQLQIG
jgi:hypothetical protein